MCVSAVRTGLDSSTILEDVHPTYNYIVPQTENISRNKSKGRNNMGFYFTKSVKAISLSMVKSMDFKQLKTRLINHLKKQMKKEETKEFSKSVVSPPEKVRVFYQI